MLFSIKIGLIVFIAIQIIFHLGSDVYFGMCLINCTTGIDPIRIGKVFKISESFLEGKIFVDADNFTRW